MPVKISTRNILFPVILVTCTLLASGCAFSSSAPNIHQTAKGTVYLENVSDWSYQADHPTVIDQQTMRKVVKGLLADDVAPPLVSTKLPASGSKPMRVFSDEDTEFLAPLLAQGLSQAKPEQLVGFRVSPSAGSGAEPTAGTLYVRQGAIHITISSSKGMTKTTGFLPPSVARTEPASPIVAHGAQGVRSIVIDYQALAKTTASPAAPAPMQNTAAEQESARLAADESLMKKMEELRQAKEAATLKESEISVLRKENTWLKEKLREKTAQIDALKASTVASKPAPKPNPKHKAELQPTR